jgi:hypothetical protein
VGDRANFGFRQGEDVIFLYGHWAGYEMLKTLADALKASAPRWNDVAYGTRWTISNIIGTDWAGEYGWGLTVNALCDNEHSIPVVDFAKGTVSLHQYDWKAEGDVMRSEPKFTVDIPFFVLKYGSK